MLVPEKCHQGKSGFLFSYPPGARPETGYLLLSRFEMRWNGRSLS